MNKEIPLLGILLMLFGIVLTNDFEAQTSDPNPNGFNTFYFDNGAVSSEGNLLNGKPEGYWKNYYSSGGLKSAGNRKNHLLDGVWKFYSEEGVPTEEISYQENLRSGPTKIFSKEGFILDKIEYESDLKNGLSYTYFLSGGLKRETPFENGRENGTSYEYNQEGRIITLRVYKNGILSKQQNVNRKDAEGNKTGLWTEFNSDKTIKAEGNYKNGEKDGYWKEYTEKGNLLETTKFQTGELINNPEELTNLDVKEIYFEEGEAEGKLQFRGTYREGKKQGTHLWFSVTGSIDSAKVYNQDVLIARGNMERGGLRIDEWQSFYYPTGELKSKGVYTRGYKSGLWTYYFMNGNTEQTGRYTAKAKPEGEWKWYYDNGQLLREESFVNGEENGWLIEYGDTGQIITKGEYIKGKEEGEWLYEIGDHKEQGSYEYGAKMGVWKHTYLNSGEEKFEGEFFDDLEQGKHVWYYPSGQKMLEGKYTSGVKEGDWRRYNEDGTLLISIEYNSGIEVKVDGVKMKEIESE